jgi:hypothetical protein
MHLLHGCAHDPWIVLRSRGTLGVGGVQVDVRHVDINNTVQKAESFDAVVPASVVHQRDRKSHKEWPEWQGALL